MSTTVGLYYVRWDGGQIIDQYNGGPVPFATTCAARVGGSDDLRRVWLRGGLAHLLARAGFALVRGLRSLV